LFGSLATILPLLVDVVALGAAGVDVPLAVALGDWGGVAPAGIWLALSATVCTVGVVTAARAYWLISAGAPVPGPTTGEYAFPGIADG
jgi:hypothetical protein